VQALTVVSDNLLASGGNDHTIRLWDLARGAEARRLEGHGDGVLALAVLPGGRLASGGADRTIRLWDPARGAEIARLEVDGAVICLAALLKGRLVAGDVLGRLHWLVIAE
jgi:WD40 repeat protein